MAEGIVKKQKKELSLEEYKEHVAERLKNVYSIFERTATGDFSVGIEIPEKEDEFTELLVGLKFMLEDLQELMRVKEEAAAENARAEEAEKYSKELEKKIRDLERFQKVTMDREKRVLELKKEIKELKKQLEKGEVGKG